MSNHKTSLNITHMAKMWKRGSIGGSDYRLAIIQWFANNTSRDLLEELTEFILNREARRRAGDG